MQQAQPQRVQGTHAPILWFKNLAKFFQEPGDHCLWFYLQEKEEKYMTLRFDERVTRELLDEVQVTEFPEAFADIARKTIRINRLSSQKLILPSPHLRFLPTNRPNSYNPVGLL
jgi:hypothetical protein